MSAEEHPALNPYAPSSLPPESVGRSGEPFPESGVPFSGMLDLQSVRNTHRLSLTAGLVFSLSFAGLLVAGALLTRTPAAVVVLGVAVASTLLALVGFIYGQREKPLRHYYWMQGLTEGTLRPHRLDIRWDEGAAAGSFLFRGKGTDRDFQNRHGRLFVLREIPCFIPKPAVAADHWHHVKSFRSTLPSDIRPTQSLLDDPPVAEGDGVLSWPVANQLFFADRARHEFVCAPPAFSRLLFFLSLVALVLMAMNDRRSGIAIFVVGSMFVLAAVFWLARVGTRRHWPFRLPAMFHSWRKPAEFTPSFSRWMDADRVLIGFVDAWICVPWAAIQKVVVSPHAIEFSVTPLRLDRWYLERGGRSDEQWRAVVRHVRSHVNNVTLHGVVRSWPT